MGGFLFSFSRNVIVWDTIKARPGFCFFSSLTFTKRLKEDEISGVFSDFTAFLSYFLR